MVELQARLGKAGIVVDEARLSHLAYAPEIAGAMLRRQQAEAVVAARMKIVEGAVGMVEMALDHMARSKQIVLDDERKAAISLFCCAIVPSRSICFFSCAKGAPENSPVPAMPTCM